ncbi:MAG: tyrosine-type recombinase/integrase [Sporichthyaceae bacterium]
MMGDETKSRPHSGGGNNKGSKATYGSIRQRGPKRFQARYSGPDGRTYTARTPGGAATFQSKADANGALARVRVEIEAGTWRSPDDITTLEAEETVEPVTFAEYATTWLAERQLADRTRVEYRRTFENRLKPTFGAMPLGSITRASVRTWHAKQVAEGKPTAAAHAFALLRTIMATAVDDELIPGPNPARIRAATSVQRAKEPIPLTKEQVRAIADEVPARYKVAVLLGAYCSLRYGEIAGLQRQDVADEGRTIRIRRAAFRVDGELRLKQPKTRAGIGDVAVPGSVAAALVEHLDEWTAEATESPVFPAASTGGILSHDMLRKVFRRAAKACGRPDATLHLLRHSGQTWSAEAGASLPVLMARARQVSPQAALKYLHQADGAQRALADKLDDG